MLHNGSELRSGRSTTYRYTARNGKRDYDGRQKWRPGPDLLSGLAEWVDPRRRSENI